MQDCLPLNYWIHWMFVRATFHCLECCSDKLFTVIISQGTVDFSPYDLLLFFKCFCSGVCFFVCLFFLNRRISLSLILLLTHWEQFDVGNFISFFSPLVISCHMISTCHLWNTRYVVSKSQMHYIVSIFVWAVTLLMQFLSSSLWNQSIQTGVWW